MRCGFQVGYSPERINPGDKVHRLETIVKIVSGMDEETLDTIAKVYELVVEAGVYRADSIKVAEAAKVIENSQRDINIAFMNELSIIFNKLGIDTKSVLEAAGTKWNFLNFFPGSCRRSLHRSLILIILRIRRRRWGIIPRLFCPDAGLMTIWADMLRKMW